MTVSRMTAMMVRVSEIEIIQSGGRWEAWSVTDGVRVDKLLSCELGKRADLEDAIRILKSDESPV